MRQSLFEDPVERIEDLNLKSRLLYINFEDLVFSPLPQLLCQNCGMFGRTYRCPPFTTKYFKTREILSQYNNFLILISESNKEDIEKRYKYEIEECKVHEWKAWFYAGTQANMINIGRVRADLKTTVRFIRSRYDNYKVFDVGGGCQRCRPCKKQLQRSCAHPNESFPSPEGSGIDLYSTLRKKGFDFETPPKTKYISVAMIVWRT